MTDPAAESATNQTEPESGFSPDEMNLTAAGLPRGWQSLADAGKCDPDGGVRTACPVLPSCLHP